MFAWLPIRAFTSKDRYKSFRTLKGHTRGVMTVDLSCDGDLLASGGGDGVKVWDLRSGTSFPTPGYRGSVGPTSKLLWITAPGNDRHTLCYGTGLGYLCIWMQSSHRGMFSELCSKRLGDGGEITALASVHNRTADTRIAVGTRTHIIQVYQYDGREDLLPIFSVRMPGVIPIAIAFAANKAHDLYVFGLHDGAMHTVSGKDGKILHTKQLARQIGYASLDAKRELVLVDNIEDGFDMFEFERGIFVRSFPTGVPDRYLPRQVAFAEKARAVVGGSDHGSVYVFDRKTGAPLEVLRHADGGLVQTVAAFDGAEGTTIIGASSSSSARGTIQVWQKQTVRRNTPAAHGYSIGGLLRMVWQAVMIVATLMFVCQNLQLELPRPSWMEIVLQAIPPREPTTAVNVVRPAGFNHHSDVKRSFFPPTNPLKAPRESFSDEDMSGWAEWVAYKRFDDERRRRTGKVHNVILL